MNSIKTSAAGNDVTDGVNNIGGGDVIINPYKRDTDFI